MKTLKFFSFNNKFFHFTVALIFAISAFIRLANLQAFPPVLNRDEAALAYNAKLISETGLDEWQMKFPLQFRSFGDYKLPGYVYLLTSFSQIFGEADWVVRLPSALAGLGIIVVGSALITTLLQDKKLSVSGKKLNGNKLIFAISLFLLSFTPVFFFYSRMGWEANVGLFLMLSGIWFAVRSDAVKLKWLNSMLATLMMLLAVFTYNTPLLLLPFLLPFIIVFFELKNWRNWLPIAIGWSLVLLLGIGSLLSVADQKSNITIFSDPTVANEYPEFRQQFPSSLQTLLGNKYVYGLSLILKNYVKTFSPQFLITQGGSHPWHSILGRGHIYWSVYLFFIIGLLGILNKIIKSTLSLVNQINDGKKSNRVLFVLTKLLKYREVQIFYLLLISPLPAVVTIDAPHATRSLFTFVMIILISVRGLVHFSKLFEIKKKWLGVITISIFLLIVSIESVKYLNQFFYQWREALPSELEVSYKHQLQTIQNKYSGEKIAVVDESGYLYILTAWYTKISASEFFSTIERHQPDTIGLSYGYRVGNFRFIRSIEDLEEESVVIVKQDNEWKIERK